MSHNKDYKVISNQTVAAAAHSVPVSTLSDLKACFLIQGGGHADSWEEVKGKDPGQETAAGWGLS